MNAKHIINRLYISPKCKLFTSNTWNSDQKNGGAYLVCGWRQWCAWINVTMTFIILSPNLDHNRLIPLLSYFFLIPNVRNTFTDLVRSFVSNLHRFCGNLITILYNSAVAISTSKALTHIPVAQILNRGKNLIQKENGRLPDSVLL
jgi:hypothetical protein